MRNEWLPNIERLDESLPGSIIDTEDRLSFLHVLLTLFGDCPRIFRCCELSVIADESHAVVFT